MDTTTWFFKWQVNKNCNDLIYKGGYDHVCKFTKGTTG